VLAASFLSAPAAHGQQPAVGQVAPAFTLPDQQGTPVSLQSYRGKWVVLYFYPKDLATGSTAEAKSFEADLAQYAKWGVVVGISGGTVQNHKKFAAAAGITFPLLVDSNNKVAQAYGSLGTHNGVAAPNRNTFLIDPQGKVARVWTNVAVPATHSSDVLQELSVKPPIIHPTLTPEMAAPRPQSVKPPIIH
jgi:peroxiredoxin Q/BCP